MAYVRQSSCPFVAFGDGGRKKKVGARVFDLLAQRSPAQALPPTSSHPPRAVPPPSPTMAPYLSLLPLRREKPKLPPSAATPPSPANLDRFFADSPAPPTRTSTATHGRPAASHAMDESIVDFGELLQSSGDGGFDMLNDGDLPSFWAEDSLLVLPGASDGKGKAKAKEAIQEHSAEKLAPRKETPSESQQQQAGAASLLDCSSSRSFKLTRWNLVDSAEQSKLNRRTSLARLPIPIPLLSAPPAAHPAAIPVPSRRQSLARPAHILPAHHPAHPRPLALSSHPTTVPAAPSHSTSLHSISTSYANPSNPSSEASIFKPLTTSTPLPVSRPERRQSLAAPTFSPILSLPSPAANPDDMFARRARDSDLHKGIELEIQEEVEVGVGGMTSTPRVERGVKFALPEMEEGISVIFEEKDEDEEEAVEQGPTMEPVVELEAPPQRRRASRAFLALPASDPFVTSSSEAISASATLPSIARRASRAFKFPAPPSQTPSAAPTRVLATSAPAPTPLSRSVEPPLSIIRLIVPHSTRPLAESGKSRTTAARATSTKKKTPAAVAGPVLTLPRDFSFGARAAEREEEKKKRAEEREREKLAKAKEVQVRAKRKAVSGWGVPAGEKVPSCFSVVVCRKELTIWRAETEICDLPPGCSTCTSPSDSPLFRPRLRAYPRIHSSYLPASLASSSFLTRGPRRSIDEGSSGSERRCRWTQDRSGAPRIEVH